MGLKQVIRYMGYHNQKSNIKNQVSKIKLLAPAKINIGLVVKEKLPSGYHLIETIMVPIKLFDTLIIRRIGKGIQFKTNSRKIPSGKDNLVFKAGKLFFDTTKIAGGAKIELKKKIPVGAGLGGGSSDAAYTLLGLNKIYGNLLTFSQLKGIAIKIGMDVPFFLYRKSCYATGRGEILEPLKIPKLNIVLYMTSYPISTKWAYQNIAAGLTDHDFSLKLLSKRLINNDLFGINALISNTFESAVFDRYTDLLKVKSLFIANGAYAAGLSGSGSAVYGLFNKTTLRKNRYKFNRNVLITETL